MPFTKVVFRPGINRDITQYTNEGGWYDCDKIRFREGFPEKLGGWMRFTNNTFLGTCRKLLEWYDLDADRFVALGTSEKLYVNNGGTYYDITPIRKTTNPMANNPFATVNLSTTVTVTDAAHGASVGDYVTYSGAAVFNNVDMNGEFVITTILTANTYTVTATTIANATGSGGGAAVIAAYQLPVGSANGVGGNGWGAGYWGGPTGWGLSVGPSLSTAVRLWSLDDYGEDLVAAVRGGEIYYWARSSGVTARAVEIGTLGGAADTPDIVAFIQTSDQDRRVFAYGVNPIGSADMDPLLIRWSDSEDVADWSPTAVNSAGEIKLTGGSAIISAVKTKQETLVFTDTAVWSLQYVGGTDIYGINLLTDAVTTPVSQNAAVWNGNVVVWMGIDNFYFYDGSVKPLPCTVRDYVYSDLNKGQTEIFHTGLSSGHDEIWFFYCSAASTDIDRYVIWNFVENTWVIGTLRRDAWCPSSFEQAPISTSVNRIYVQEQGDNDDEDPMVPFIESADFDIGDGQNIMFLRRLIPDIDFQEPGTVDVSLKVRDWPGSAKVTEWTDSITSTTTQLWPRARGRQASIRFESDDLGSSWRLGSQRLDLVSDGMR